MPVPLFHSITDAGQVPVLVIGNDALLAALPAHPVQVAHACHALGVHSVVPASWGEELVAEHVLHEMEQRGRTPSILCACRKVETRLRATGSELDRFLVHAVAPPIAVARHLRAMYLDTELHLTYAGVCDGGRDEVYDAHCTGRELLETFTSHGIDVHAQPHTFDSVVPPDRRRYLSLPGGCPSPEALWSRVEGCRLEEVREGELAPTLADILLEHDHVLVDLAPCLGCACTGAVSGVPRHAARIAVTSLEPPRATSHVIEPLPALDLQPALAVAGADNSVGIDEPLAQPVALWPPTDIHPASARLTHQPAASPIPPRRARPIAITPSHALRAIRTPVTPVRIRTQRTPPEPALEPARPATDSSAATLDRPLPVPLSGAPVRWGEPHVRVVPPPPSKDWLAVAVRVAGLSLLLGLSALLIFLVFFWSWPPGR